MTAVATGATGPEGTRLGTALLPVPSRLGPPSEGGSPMHATSLSSEIPIEAPVLSVEDLGEDVLVLASVAIDRGRASLLRSLNGRTVRVIVEAA